MSIDARMNFALLKSKTPDTENDIGLNQKIRIRQMHNLAGENERKLRVAASVNERNTKFLQKRLDKAEELLEKHGLLEEYRRTIIPGQRNS